MLPIIATIAGSLISAGAANKAANAQSASADKQIELQREIFDKTSGYFEPYRAAGENALRFYSGQLGQDFRSSPGYQAGMQEGVNAIDASAASRGNLFSGSTLQSLNRFGQDYADRGYNQWLGRWAGLADMGQASAAMQAGNANNFATNASNALAAKGNAQAAGAIGVGNALTNGLNQGVGIWQYQNMLKQLPTYG